MSGVVQHTLLCGCARGVDVLSMSYTWARIANDIYMVYVRHNVFISSLCTSHVHIIVSCLEAHI